MKSHRGEKSQQVFAAKIILFHIFIKKIMVFSRLPCLEFTSCFNFLNRNWVQNHMSLFSLIKWEIQSRESCKYACIFHYFCVFMQCLFSQAIITSVWINCLYFGEIDLNVLIILYDDHLLGWNVTGHGVKSHTFSWVWLFTPVIKKEDYLVQNIQNIYSFFFLELSNA